jgi:hypothetical protein
MCIIPPVVAWLASQKQFKKMALFGVPTLIASFVYFYNLDATRINPIYLWNHLDLAVVRFFSFAGGSMWLPTAKFLAFTLGLVCFAVFAWGIVKKHFEKYPFIYLCLAFLYLSSLAAVVGDSTTSINPAPLRYRIYCSLFPTLTALLLGLDPKMFFIKKIAFLIPVFAILFGGGLDVLHCLKMQKICEFKKVSSYNWYVRGSGLANYLAIEKSEYYLNKAQQLGLYQMPKYPLENFVLRPSLCTTIENRAYSDNLLFSVDRINEADNFFIVQGWVYSQMNSMEFTDILVFLNGQNGCFVFKTFMERHYLLVNYNPTKTDCGFFIVFDKTTVPPGIYTIELGIKSVLNRNKPVVCIKTKSVLEI